MKVLLLGAEGQLGRALIAAAPSTAELIPCGRAECDLSVPGRSAEVIRDTAPQIIINAAAYTAVDRAESEPELARRINAEAPGEIALASESIGCRLVHVSTDFVFGGEIGTPRTPADETHPLGVYGRTKLEGERAVLSAAPDNLVVRTAWLYAPHGHNFMKTMVRLMRAHHPVNVVADQIGTPTSAGSLAHVLWQLAGQEVSGVQHYTDAGAASWYDFAVAIQEEAHSAGLLTRASEVVPIRTVDYPTPARRPPFSVLDSFATYRLLGTPAPHWRVNLRQNLKELAQNG